MRDFRPCRPHELGPTLKDVKQLVRREWAAGPPRECRYCHRSIVHASDIGWIDAEPGGSYDMCPDDTWGEHEPVVRLPPARSNAPLS